jgi:PAS domain-containing protein
MRRRDAMRGRSPAAGAPRIRCRAVAARASRVADREVLNPPLKAKRKRPTKALRVLFENSPDALFVIAIDLSDQFRLEKFNPAFTCLFGMSVRTERGDAPHQVLPGTIAEQFAGSLHYCRRSGLPTQLEMSVARASGIARWEFLLTPIPGLLGWLERIAGQGRVREDRRWC